MHSVLDSDCTEEGNIHVLLISMLTLSHPQHYFPDVLFSLWSHKKYLNFGSLGMLGFKLLPELISAILIICERIWEKGPLRAEAEFLFLIAHNFKAIIAIDLKPGIAILQSLHYTRCKFRAPPTSGLGVAIASVTRGRKSAVLYLPLVPHHFR